VITAERPITPSRVASASVVLGHRWVLAVALAATLLGELPLVLSACCAPPDATGLGTVWFINDFAQYESAMRQGAAQSGWLVYDAFSAEPHQPALMFPVYVALGKLAAASHVPATVLERLAEAVARISVVLAIWHFARTFTSNASAARWATILALFGSGFEIIGAALGGYTGNWSYESNGFGLLFAAPHVPLAMAATLVLAARYLRPRNTLGPFELVTTAGLSASVALLHPFHLPVLLGALIVTGVVFWRTGRGVANLAAALAASLGALPVLVPTVTTFAFDPFWLQTYGEQNVLPSPAPHELLVDFGPLLLLALGGAWSLRGRVAPFGVLVWLLLLAIAMYLPAPFQRRLSFGIQPSLAILAANALVAWSSSVSPHRATLIRLAIVAASASGTVLILVGVVASGFTNAPLEVYRSTRQLDAVAAWLNERAAADEVILADWPTSNYLAPRTAARVFGGHPVATLHAQEKRFIVASVFAHPSSLLVAGSLGAHWLVYGPAEGALQPQATPAFEAGSTRVYRVRAP
jgi:hypothetical protein